MSTEENNSPTPPNNQEDELKSIKESADQGDSDSMTKYADKLIQNAKEGSDSSEAVKYYKMAIEKGNTTAMHNYGRILEEGHHVTEDKASASKYYKLAADQGHALSMLKYARLCTDITETDKYLTLATESGDYSVIGALGVAFSKCSSFRRRINNWKTIINIRKSISLFINKKEFKWKFWKR